MAWDLAQSWTLQPAPAPGPATYMFLQQGFLQPLGRCVQAMQQYWQGDQAGLRDISAAHGLLDEATAMVAAKVPSDLAARCR